MDSEELKSRTWDGLIVVCGYEQRARAVAVAIEGRFERGVALFYESNRVLDYDENARYYDAQGFLHKEAVPAGARAAIDELLKGHDENRPYKLSIDFSSMDRDLIAAIADYLVRQEFPVEVVVTFVYSEGDFESAPAEDEALITVNRPAVGLSGWTSDPTAPLVAVLGLGFESDLALAALESLEPSNTYLFEPSANDSRFEQRVWARNESLLSSYFENLSTYDVSQPVALYRALYTFAAASVSSRRIVFIALGPKVFAMAAAIVTAQFVTGVSAWRVSAGEARIPRNRRGTGRFVAFELYRRGGNVEVRSCAA